MMGQSQEIYDNSILSSSPMKAGEGNPQAREEEGKLGLLGLERSSSLAGIPRIWGLGKLPLSSSHHKAIYIRFFVEQWWSSKCGKFFVGMKFFVGNSSL